MRKLTKRVQAGGLWFDVNKNAKSVTFDANGDVCCWQGDVYIAPNGAGWSGCGCDPVGRVDLEGADWRECGFYVGDQVDGEAVERREWMARGADSVVEALSSSGAFTFGECVEVTANHAEKIRDGEVE